MHTYTHWLAAANLVPCGHNDSLLPMVRRVIAGPPHTHTLTLVPYVQTPPTSPTPSLRPPHTHLLYTLLVFVRPAKP